MRVRAQLLENWSGPLPAAGRLPRHYVLEVASTRTVCDGCGAPLRRQRSSTQYPRGLMLGQPRVRCVQKQCIRCGRSYHPEAYRQLVPPQGNYAFDLIVHVGLARFRQHRQNREIQQELHGRWELWLPTATISELAQAFLDGLAATHQAHAPQLRKELENDGGYALHVDGTCEPGTDTVFNAVAGNRGWTLAGAKMSGEDVQQIAGLLRRCAGSFGMPLGVVRDLSPQIQAAAEAALPGVPDLICHYHFLENVGSRLCEKPHAKLTAGLRRLKIQAALRSLRKDLVRYSKQKLCLSARQVEQFLQSPQRLADLDPLPARRLVTYLALRWMEDYGADLHGEFFPFDLPSLAVYRRALQVHDWLAGLTTAADFPHRELPTLGTILRHLTPLKEDAEVTAAAQRLEKAKALLDELRGVLRLTSDPRRTLPRPLAEADGAVVAQEMERSLRAWMDQLRERLTGERDADKAADLQTVLRYLDKYQHKLVGHVIPRAGAEGPFVVERTNNVSEHRFATTKQGLRRKLGTKRLTRFIQAMRPEELLVANLDDATYVEIVCAGHLQNLAALFAQNWQAGQAIRKERRKRATNHPIPTRKKTLRDQGFLPRLKGAVDKLIEVLLGRCAA